MHLDQGKGVPGKNFFYRLLAVGIAFIALTQLGHQPKSTETMSGVIRTYVLDDSMITLRVANNFAHGAGPYFNSGEHTAANTSLFWPLLLSLRFHYAADLSEAVLSLSHFSWFLCLAILGVVALSAESTLAACMTLFLLVLSPCFLEYGSSVWEHIPQSLLVTLALCLYTGKLGWQAAWREEFALFLLSLAFLIRPDTLPLLAIFLGIALLKFYRQPNRTSLAWICCCPLLIGFYFGLHHHFYGTFAPNTYYLKVTPGWASIAAGMRYLKESVFQSAVPLLIAYLAIMSFRKKETPATSKSNVIVIVCCVLQVFYIVVVGGDVFRFGRFFILLAPITILLFCESLARLRSRDYFQISAAAVIFLVVLHAFSRFRDSIADVVIPTGQGNVLKQDPQAAQASLVEFLQKNISPDDGQIGLCWLGTLSYYMPQYQFADFLGKADAHIAHEAPKWGPVGHNKWDIEYSLVAHHISAIPIEPIEADYESALEVMQSHRRFGFWAAIVTDPYTRTHYTYFSPAELNLPSTWGLLVRNDLIPKLQLSKAPAAIGHPRVPVGSGAS